MRWLRNPMVIVFVGIAFRILLIAPVRHWLGTPGNPFAANEPSHIAAHLVRGDGFASPFTDLPIPTAQQPPLYPLFLAGIFQLFGSFCKASLYVILAANCVAGGVTAFFVYRAGVKHFSSLTGVLCAWAWSIFTPVAITDLTLSGYTFATLAVVLWLNFVPDLLPTTRNWILLGIAVGFMLLLNPMLGLLIPASALWLNKKQAVIMLATAFLCVVPWYARNYRVMGHLYPALRDNFGLELYLGNHPGMSGTYDYHTGESPYGSELPKLGEARFFQMRESEAIAYIKSAPVDFIVRSMKRCVEFWSSPWPIAYAFILILAIWGIRMAPPGFAVFTITMFVFYPPIFYVTQCSWPTAYRHPIEPMILLMAAGPVCRWVRRRQRVPSFTADI